MKEVSLEELLEAGCHFGHQVTRHNPKARDYIFESRDNIHIIDLAKTKEGLEQAASFVKKLASTGKTMIIVGTKRQARTIVEQNVKRVQENGVDGIFYVKNRWIGGTLTNLPEVTKNFKKLKDYSEKLQSNETKARYTKKEIGQWQKERAKLEGFYGGISEMQKNPDALFIIDTHLEHLAVKEAHAVHVPIVGITDTNADPHIIDYPIPANDDAVGSIEFITNYIIDAWIEGRTKLAHDEEKIKADAEKKAKKEEAKTEEVKETVTKEKEEPKKEEKPKAKKKVATKNTKK